jgi:sugar (pentulose or hexulose) kinase
MATLATLKLSTAVKPTHMPAVQVRRNKLAKRLWEQMELAKAQQAGTQFTPTKLRTVVENDTGMRKQVEVFKRVKQWWFVAESGKLVLNIRYGARLLELAKGKSSIEMANAAELVPTLELVKRAVEAGELDAQIETAALKLRDGFGK